MASAAPLRAFRRSMSALSRSAVTTLQLFHFAGQILEVCPLPYLRSPKQRVVALECYGALALVHAPLEHAGDDVAHVPLDLGELPCSLRLPAPPGPPAPLLCVSRVMRPAVATVSSVELAALSCASYRGAAHLTSPLPPVL